MIGQFGDVVRDVNVEDDAALYMIIGPEAGDHPRENISKLIGLGDLDHGVVVWIFDDMIEFVEDPN